MNMNTIFVEGDPYLAYQPDFSKSLPVQLFVNGITITLLIVLLFHLLFTTQYHYPLAPLNYCLQLISILVVVISVIVKTWATLTASADNSSYWPYDLDYIAVDIPPPSWNTGEKAAWWLLQALNNVFVNITHIQFLTLLYPSRTEARLIIFILGPLAIVSSGLVFTALSGSQRVLDITDSIRNILNSTLLLIFTIALVLWGFLVNRRRAWRTDGGTAVFGTGSLLLAVVSTSCNFVAVAEEGIEWLQHLLFAAIVWQTWLGWWWWVGSGMGIGEVEDLMERAEKKKRKAAKRAARIRAQNAALANGNPRNGLRRHASVAGIVDAGQASANAMAGLSSSVTSILLNRSGTRLKRQRATSTSDIEHADTVEMDVLRNARRTATADGQGSTEIGQVPSSPSRVGFSDPRRQENPTRPDTSNSETSSTSATPSLHSPKSLGQLLSFPTTWLQIYIRRLAKAHQEAARKQVLQRADIRSQVFDPHRNSADISGAGTRSPRVEDDGLGWGLGKFGIKEHQDGARRLQEARERLREERLLSTPGGDESEAGPSRPRRQADVEEGVDEEAEEDADAGPSGSGGAEEAGATGSEREEDWEDVDGTSSSSSGPGKDKKNKKKGKQKAGEPGRDPGGGGVGGGGAGGAGTSGWSWWGPLKQWRLADRSTF